MSRRPIPSLSGLRAFEVFARSGSMTRAAEELGVTHGAVSRRIKALEDRLGARLVAGPRHRLALTAAGRELAAALSPAFDMIAAALPGAERDEELVISCLGTFAMKWLIPRLPRFLDSRPGLRVRILESHQPADFSQGGLHGAIRIVGPAPIAGIRAQPFMAHAHGPVLSAARFAEIGDEPARLLTLPRLHAETFRPAWANWARAAGIELPPSRLDRAFEHNSYMLEAAAAGLGVAVAPWAFAQADIERGRLVAPWGFQPIADRYAFLRPALADNPAAAAFGDWLVSEGRRAAKPPTPLLTSRV
jgi:LysR family transcriptional regulator, glycine cleavage system transcriptional activator